MNVHLYISGFVPDYSCYFLNQALFSKWEELEVRMDAHEAVGEGVHQ